MHLSGQILIIPSNDHLSAKTLSVTSRLSDEVTDAKTTVGGMYVLGAGRPVGRPQFGSRPHGGGSLSIPVSSAIPASFLPSWWQPSRSCLGGVGVGGGGLNE